MGRKVYSREFKVSAVKLVQEQNYSASEAAKRLGVDVTSIRSWVKKFGAEAGGDGQGDAALRAELRRLREENKRLLMEREILKKATVFFAKHES
jgi:transposase